NEKLFFFGAEGNKPIEYVSFMLGLTAPLLAVPQLREPPAQLTRVQEIDLYNQGAWRKAKMISRAALQTNEIIEGPAILEDATSTWLVPSDWQAQRDDHASAILTLTG